MEYFIIIIFRTFWAPKVFQVSRFRLGLLKDNHAALHET